MRINNIALENFRNYKKIEVSLNSDLVLILGQNASGKTNFLECIYFLSRLKSFRAPDNLLVKNGEDFFKIKVKAEDTNFEAIVQINPLLKRSYKIKDAKVKRGFWESFAVVLFVPNNLNLFQLGPILRRKFLDETILQIDQEYSLDLESLDHILKQKAALLEQIYLNKAQAADLDFWNQQLVPVALRLTNKRQEFIDFINQGLTLKIKELTGFENNFIMDYKRIFSKTEAELLEKLKEHEPAEIRSGKNLIGPHRDDFVMQKDALLNLFNSSRGELRAQVLALKLLQAEYLTQKGRKPVILLDDVFSELDELRRNKLIENLSDHQIFISSTEEHHLPKLAKETLVLKVENNVII